MKKYLNAFLMIKNVRNLLNACTYMENMYFTNDIIASDKTWSS